MSLYALSWLEIMYSHIYRLTRALNHYKEICTVTCCEAICPLPLPKNSLTITDSNSKCDVSAYLCIGYLLLDRFKRSRIYFFDRVL